MGCFLSLLRHSVSSFKWYFPRHRSTPVFFKGLARHQNFALPDPIMDYISKNASSALVHRKLVKSCKYFFIKNPIIVIPCLHETNNGFQACLIDKNGYEKFDINKISTKLWLSNKFGKSSTCFPFPASSTFPIKIMISKLYRVEASGIRFEDTFLTFEDFMFFGSRETKYLHLRDCIIQYEKGESVQLETLITQFPLLHYLFYTCHSDGSDISIHTVKEIFSNPSLSNLRTFILLEIPDTFDIENLFEYIKNRNDFYCLLHFHSNISAAYHERVEAIIDELLSTETTSYRFPFIVISNMNPDTLKAMKKRRDEDCMRRDIKYSKKSL